MTAAKAKKGKRSKKRFRIEMTRLALAAWSFGLLLALAWMFLLGLFMGKGITPSNINFAKIRKRMATEGVWPGSGENTRSEKPEQEMKTQKKIPLKDLLFYKELDKKKKAGQISIKEKKSVIFRPRLLDQSIYHISLNALSI